MDGWMDRSINWSMGRLTYWLIDWYRIFSAFVTAKLNSWSLYIHGYTTRTPPVSKDHRHWSASSALSANPCDEPLGFGPVKLTGVHPVAHTLLITVCLVLWKAVILTCSELVICWCCLIYYQYAFFFFGWLLFYMNELMCMYAVLNKLTSVCCVIKLLNFNQIKLNILAYDGDTVFEVAIVCYVIKLLNLKFSN